MRRLIVLAALALLAPGWLAAQQAADSSLARDLRRLAAGEQLSGLPPADSVSPGARSIPAGSTVAGSVVARGPVDVAGRVEGHVVSLGGDVTVRAGGSVGGDAVSVGGRVLADSGIVEGEMRALGSLPAARTTVAAAPVVRTPARRTLDALGVVAGSFGVLLIVALGVLLFAGHNLDETVTTLELRFGRAFWVGLLGQLLVLPALLVLVVALALTLIGILLIPFAIVTYAIAVAGLVTLGFLAVARLVGGALWRGADSTERSRALMSLAIGVALFYLLWSVAAALAWAPLAATVVRAAALAATWAAVTIGLGAAILSRAGTSRQVAGRPRVVELAAWQTPTPVTGVPAARRQTAGAGRE